MPAGEIFPTSLIFIRPAGNRQQSKAIYHWGIRRRRRKIGKHGKEGKRKWWVLIVSLFPARKWEAVNQGGTRGKDHAMFRKTQGAGGHARPWAIS